MGITTASTTDPQKTSTGSQLKTIGILGGTFDPIHNGHIDSAKQAASWLGIKQLMLMPCHIAPHKNYTNASSQQRAAMVQLVCNKESLFELDDRELRRQETSFTVKSLKEIENQQPDTQIFFLMGLDSLLTFTSWYQWQDILKLCHIVVIARPGYDTNKLNSETQALLKQYQEDDLNQVKARNSGCIIFTPNHLSDISSTQIRHQIANKTLNKDLLPASVLYFINKYQLYR
ncbi:MAG: nicotinate-nucleotide adenylyltransferase [Alteromonadaceae bacterium]|nr:nicotinate-nucleotide adenylyltransferase [Alteromonadaceae bacterium]